MIAVVTDTSPIHYLILSKSVEVLPMLFQKIIMPTAVRDELSTAGAPVSVREWVNELPAWIEVREPRARRKDLNLDAGETDALSVAIELSARAVLMDERKGRATASRLGLTVIGTVALLEEADHRGVRRFEDSMADLRSFRFRISDSLARSALERVRARRQSARSKDAH